MQINVALRNLYKAVTGSTEPPKEDQIAELVQKIADDWESGAGGKGIKAIAFTKDASGTLTGGTVTYTDDTTGSITVTTTEV